VFLGIIVLQNAWGALIGFHIGLLPVVIPNWKGISRSFRSPVSRNILWSVSASGLSAGIGLWLVWTIVGIPIDFRIKMASLGLDGVIWPLFILYFTLVNPWLEEAYWRYYLMSPSRFPALVDFLFAGYHIIILSKFVGPAWMLITFVILSFAAWFWRQISRYTQSLMPAVLAHMMADLSLLIAIYIFAVFPT
jgi:membrane protease YdiL (CAAX protease family)